MSSASFAGGALSPLVEASAPGVERRIAWLRIPLLGLALAAHGLGDGNARDASFVAAVFVAAAYGVGMLVFAFGRRVPARGTSAVVTAMDIAVVATIVGLVGGATADVHWALGAIPVLVAFRLDPLLTLAAGVGSAAAYSVQAAADWSWLGPEPERAFALHLGYAAWVLAAATLVSALLRMRTERVDDLLAVRRRLAYEALSAEEGQRRSIAEDLHNFTIQTLSFARQELTDVSAADREGALGRVDDALRSTIEDLRRAVFQLHPYVAQEVGVAATLRAIAEDAARRGRFRLNLDVAEDAGESHGRVLLGAARELLANVVRHADAETVSVRLERRGHEVVLTVRDDGSGFDPSVLPARLAAGHIGLTSQRARVESVGGAMAIQSGPGRGTAVEIRLPA